MKKRDIFLCFVLLGAIVFLSGCTNEEILSKGTPTPTLTATPEPTILSTQDPIIGTWEWTVFDKSKTIFYTFTSEGQYLSSDSVNGSVERGTWMKGSDNLYNVTVEGRKALMFEYQPATRSIADVDHPEIRFTFQKIEVPTTPSPLSTKKLLFKWGNLEIFEP